MIRMPRLPLVALLTVLGATAVPAQQPPAAPPALPVYASTDKADDVLRTLDQWLGAMAGRDAFGGVVMVARDGRVLLSRVAGMADERAKVPNAPDTRFGLASVGKMFTAVAIGQLLDAGKLSLTDTVGKFLPGYPNEEVRRRVTIAHLLTHTSGLGSFFNDRYEATRGTLFTLADYLPLFERDTLLARPGTQWNYSNSGYLLLGRIIEVVAKESYYEYVRRHIFDRAGMRNTGFYDRTGGTPRGAIGYDQPDSSGRRVDNLGMRELRGSSAGGGYSTAADMVAFMAALMGDRLLRPETRVRFTTGKVDEIAGRSRYGYGFSIRVRGDTAMAIGHTGGFPGTANQVFYFPKGRYALVVLMNRTGPRDGAVLTETGKAMVQLVGRAEGQ